MGSTASIGRGPTGPTGPIGPTGPTGPIGPVAEGAKAWVNFNGTGTVAINQSYNVTSITDNGVGDYTINFTTPFANTTYAAVNGGRGPAGVGIAPMEQHDTVSRTASAVRIYSLSHTGGVTDCAINSWVFFGTQ